MVERWAECILILRQDGPNRAAPTRLPQRRSGQEGRRKEVKQ